MPLENSGLDDRILDLAGTRALLLAPHGPQLSAPRHANDFIGLAWGAEIELMIVPTTRLSPDFFQLKTRLAGEVMQKFVNYRLKLAILGDLSAWLPQSTALRDFVHESNQGRAVWFVPDLPALERKLAPHP